MHGLAVATDFIPDFYRTVEGNGIYSDGDYTRAAFLVGMRPTGYVHLRE